jgi:hypothetical protein
MRGIERYVSDVVAQVRGSAAPPHPRPAAAAGASPRTPAAPAVPPRWVKGKGDAWLVAAQPGLAGTTVEVPRSSGAPSRVELDAVVGHQGPMCLYSVRVQVRAPAAR